MTIGRHYNRRHRRRHHKSISTAFRQGLGGYKTLKDNKQYKGHTRQTMSSPI